MKNGTTPTAFLIADRLIPKGTSGDVVATERLFRPTTLAEDEVRDNSLANAAALAGKVAARDVYPGEQLTDADFKAKADPIRGRLRPNERAIAVSVDKSHGLIGDIRSGDKVDIFASFGSRGSIGGGGRGVVRTLAQDVLVLKAPRKGGAGVGSKAGSGDPVLLRLTDQGAAKIAYAIDNGKIWLVLRPPAGGRNGKTNTVTLESLLRREGEAATPAAKGTGR